MSQKLSEDIQKISNEIFKSPLSTVLLKAKMLYDTHNLDMPEFQEWLVNEINGYKNKLTTYEYRIHTANFELVETDFYSLRSFSKTIPNYFFKYSIKTIELFLTYKSKYNDNINTPVDKIEHFYLFPKYKSSDIEEIRFLPHEATLLSIIESVKQKLLDFLLIIQKSNNLKPIQIMESNNKQNLSVNGGNQVIVNNNNAQIIGNDNNNTTNQNANISTINAGNLETFKKDWADFKAQFAQEKQKISANLSTEDAEDIETFETQIATIDTQLARTAPKQNMIVGNLKTLSSGIGIGVLGNWASNYAIPLLENMIKIAATVFG